MSTIGRNLTSEIRRTFVLRSQLEKKTIIQLVSELQTVLKPYICISIASLEISVRGNKITNKLAIR